MFSVSGPGFPLFAAILTAVWYRLPQERRWAAMLAASAVFYLSLDVPGFFVLLAAAWAVWQCAKRARDRRWFALGLAAALGPLALKYIGPAAQGLNTVFGLRLWAGQGLLIPLGLAYFTLQLTGYLLDVRAGRIAPETRFARLLCYTLFFLSITQGPFNHYDRLMPQLDRAPAYSGARVWRGAQRMAWGYFKKMAVAERAAVVVNAVFAAPANFDTSQLLFAAVMFSIQLYADFSGYTDIVLGAGEALGLELPENFRQPYLAHTIAEFWERWHISLSGWLREYVFEPLAWGDWAKCLPAVGRLYQGPPMLTSLMITFVISGLWHGVGAQFLVWGALNGLYQVVSAWTRRPRKQLWKRLGVGKKNRLRGLWQIAFVFVLVTAGYVFFRAPSVSAAWQYFACMVQNHGTRVFRNYWEMGLTNRLELVLLLAGPVVVAAVDIAHECGIHLRDRLNAAPAPLRWAVYEASLIAFLMMGRFLSTGGFLYARF